MPSQATSPVVPRAANGHIDILYDITTYKYATDHTGYVFMLDQSDHIGNAQHSSESDIL